MATVTIQLRRGNASVWEKNNPVLARGEPGFVIDENRLKIGDGETAWNDLPYMGEQNVFNAQTHYDFPNIGKEYTIYKAETEALLYQWNSSSLKYEVLSSTEEKLDVKCINGGNANSGNST